MSDQHVGESSKGLFKGEYGPSPASVVRTAVKKYRILIAAITILAGLLGIGYVLWSPHQYRASSSVLIQPIAGAAFSSSSLSTPQQMTVGLATEASLITSPDVVKIADSQSGQGFESSGDSVQASVVPNTQIIEIEYTSGTSAGAQNGANNFARALLENRKSKAEALRAAQVEKLNSEIKTVSAELAKEAARKGNSFVHSARIQSLTTRLANLQTTLSSAQAISTDPGELVSPAAQPNSVAVARSIAIVAVATTLGFILALLGAIWLVWSRDRIDAASELSVAGIPIWANLELAGAGTPEPRPIGARMSGVAEDARRLRSAVVANVDRPCVLAVSSLGSLPAVAEVCVELSVALEEAGYSTTLIDADLESATVARLVELPATPGVAEVLGETSDFEGASHRSQGLRVVPSGGAPLRVIDRYSGQHFRNLLAAARASADLVVVSSPPLSTATGVSVAAAADCVVLGVVDGVTTREEVVDVVGRCAVQGVKVVGLFTLLPEGRRAPSSSDATPNALAEDDDLRERRPEVKSLDEVNYSGTV